MAWDRNHEIDPVSEVQRNANVLSSTHATRGPLTTKRRDIENSYMAKRQSARATTAEKRPKADVFRQSFPMILMRAREAVMRHFRPALRRHELTEQQWRTLRALVYYGPIEPTKLARVTFLMAPSLSRILQGLHSKSLIERRSQETDGRRSLISISRSGRRLVEILAPESKAVYKEMSRRFGKRPLAALEEKLHELEKSLLAGLPSEEAAASDMEPIEADIRRLTKRKSRKKPQTSPLVN